MRRLVDYARKVKKTEYLVMGFSFLVTCIFVFGSLTGPTYERYHYNRIGDWVRVLGVSPISDRNTTERFIFDITKLKQPALEYKQDQVDLIELNPEIYDTVRQDIRLKPENTGALWIKQLSYSRAVELDFTITDLSMAEIRIWIDNTVIYESDNINGSFKYKLEPGKYQLQVDYVNQSMSRPRLKLTIEEQEYIP